jgi:hypothetical protein
VGRHFTGVPGSISRAERILGPILKERLEMEDKYGPNWPDKPVGVQIAFNASDI